MPEQLPVVFEVQYRNRAGDPWRVLSLWPTPEQADTRLTAIKARWPKDETAYRIVKVMREVTE